jgi:hypothetical protein
VVISLFDKKSYIQKNIAEKSVSLVYRQQFYREIEKFLS